MLPRSDVFVVVIGEDRSGHALSECGPLTKNTLEDCRRELVEQNVREKNYFGAATILVDDEAILRVIEDFVLRVELEVFHYLTLRARSRP